MESHEVYDLKNTKHLSDVQSYLELVKKELLSSLLEDKSRDFENNIDNYENLVSETLKNGVKKLTNENLKDYDKIETTPDKHIFKLWKGGKCGILYKDNIILEPTYDNVLQIKGYVAVVEKKVEKKVEEKIEEKIGEENGEENGEEKKHIILNLKNGRETEVYTRQSKLEPNKEIPCTTRILPYGTVFEDDGYGWGKFINSETGIRSSDFYRISKHNNSGLKFRDYIVAFNVKFIDDKEIRLYEILDRNTLKPVYEIIPENGEYYNLTDIQYYDGVFKIKAVDEKLNPKNTYLLYKNASGSLEKSKPYKRVEIYGNLAWITEKNGEQYIINKNTQEKIYTLNTELGEKIFYEYLCGFYIKRGEKFYIINVKTGEISEEGFDEIIPIEQTHMKKNKIINNSFIVRAGENYGIMSNECKYLLNLEYDFVGMIKDSTLLTNTVILFKEKGKDKYGFYNSFSGELIGKDYDGYFLYHDNLGLIKDGEIRFVDFYGNPQQESNGEFIDSLEGSFVLDVDEDNYKAAILQKNGETIIYALPRKIDNKLSNSKILFTKWKILDKYATFMEYQLSYAKETYLKIFKNMFELIIKNKLERENEIELEKEIEAMIHAIETIKKNLILNKKINNIGNEDGEEHKNKNREYNELINILEVAIKIFADQWNNNVKGNRNTHSIGLKVAAISFVKVYNVIKKIIELLNIKDIDIGYEKITEYYKKQTKS